MEFPQPPKNPNELSAWLRDIADLLAHPLAGSIPVQTIGLSIQQASLMAGKIPPAAAKMFMIGSFFAHPGGADAHIGRT